ncbi:MAG: hypothetical protein Q8N95_08275 [Desulfobacterales bacterium]|nr:hypothetical protein [Desulfobacterales bacterium]
MLFERIEAIDEAPAYLLTVSLASVSRASRPGSEMSSTIVSESWGSVIFEKACELF